MRFTTIEEFYAARGGERSPESDYGVWWTEGTGWPWFRVSYVRETGDVYALNQATGAAEVLARVTADDADRAWEAPVDRLLDGWADRCGSPKSLTWARQQLAGAGVAA